MDALWKSEPNEASFESNGLKCAIRRVSHSGHLCGYVGVPVSHPWFGKDYNDDVPATRAQLERPVNIDKIGAINLLCAGEPTEDATRLALLIDVHGGLTYSGKGGDELLDLWVFGFDCAHSGDLCPVTAEKYGSHEFDVYRDFGYVTREVHSLAKQLAEVGGA